MANEQPAGPIQHLITVRCDLASSTLALNLTAVGIKPGDGVIWQFFDLPDAWSPWIEFSPGTPFLGPFAELTQSGAAVWGTCQEDPGAGPFLYRATIQKGQGTAWETGTAAIHSGAGTLVLGPADAGTTHHFTVTQGDGLLDITPTGVIIATGDTVEWLFQDIKEDQEIWRPLVEFHHYDGKAEVPDLYLGPFTSLTTGTDRVRGMGNNHVAGSYYFQVSVVRVSDGMVLWMSSRDPVIDNRGIVLDPGGGTGG
jgi:hypothetical protein